MAPAPDITNQRFGRLVAIRREANNARSQAMWRCRCDCGNEIVTSGIYLRATEVQSCGCLHRDTIRNVNRSHGRSHTSLHNIWKAMKGCCYCPTNTSYDRYGARGVTVCDRWRNSFEAFVQDVGERPSSDMSIERIDNAKGYEPGNVRWATLIEQGANKRNNRYIECRGRKQTVAQWSRERGIDYSLLLQRCKKGWPPERMLEMR